MSSTLNVMVTFYGWPDNDPPSDIIAYPKSDYPSCVHNHAGSNGTYEDPITVAVITKDNGGNWEPGTRMYVPPLLPEGICIKQIKNLTLFKFTNKLGKRLLVKKRYQRLALCAIAPKGSLRSRFD